MTYITKTDSGKYEVNGVEVTAIDYKEKLVNTSEIKAFEKYLRCCTGLKIQSSIIRKYGDEN